MKINIYLIVFFVLLSIVPGVRGQAQCGQPYALSNAGKAAYSDLKRESTFALGGVGYGGKTSNGEKSMDVLLDEASAKEVFFDLATTNGEVGGLYGLVGLRMIKSACLKEAREQLEKLPYSPERKAFFGTIPAGYVETMSGCIVGYEKRSEIVDEIMTGTFDKLIEFSNEFREQKARAKTINKNQ